MRRFQRIIASPTSKKNQPPAICQYRPLPHRSSCSFKATTHGVDARSMWQQIVGCTGVPGAPRCPGQVRTYGYQRAVLLVAFALIVASQLPKIGPSPAGVAFLAAFYGACAFFAWRCVVRVSDAGVTAAATNRGKTFTPWSDIRGFAIAPSWGGSSKRVDIIRTDGSTVPLDALGGWGFWRLRTEMYRDALEAERRFAMCAPVLALQ